MHVWGDNWPHWEDINKAVNLINWYARKGLLSTDAKEKWGELRWYTTGMGRIVCLHDILKAGHYYYRYGADDKPIMNIIDKMSCSYLRPFSGLLLEYKKFMYGYAYHKVVKKFPHITKEILGCVEYPELLFKHEGKLYYEMGIETDS